VGAEDNGGLKKVGCSSVPLWAPLTLEWDIITPSGTVVSGMGGTAAVLVNEIGTYTCQFLARAIRDCPPTPITVGPESATTPMNYTVAEVFYDAFIACGAISTPTNPFVHDFYEGDLRGFGYALGSTRQYVIFHVTVDPRVPNGQSAGTATIFGQTRGFANEDQNDINVCLGFAPCPSFCQLCVDANATAECALTAINGQDGSFLGTSFERVSPSLVRVQMDAVRINPCISGPINPAIDAHVTIEFRQVCSFGALYPMEYRFLTASWHDEYPWHELYINGTEIYRFDPCMHPGGPNPMNLFDDPSADIQILNSNPILGQWTEVP